MNPGNDTITILYKNRLTGDPDPFGNRLTVTSETVSGCALQPVKEGDKINETEYANATDRCICPASSAVLAINPEDQIQYTPIGADVMTYRVLGIKRYRDWWGRLDHLTLLCRWEEG